MTGLAISSVFGDPLDVKTWSGAPANVAIELQRLGVGVRGIDARISKLEMAIIAAFDMVDGMGRPINSEQILRGPRSRHVLADRVEWLARRLGVGRVLHTGTFDLSNERSPNMRHYLYCDHTWALTRAYHIDVGRYNERALAAFEQAERVAISGLTHIFTFGDYVRDSLIDDYDVPPYRVTAVGSGMGPIQPYVGPKDFTRPSLLFVAKHLFKAKGGELLLEAFDIARTHRPDLTLTIVGSEASRPFVGERPGVTLYGHMPWEQMVQFYRNATLLVQPMLNDPWGQVYLEAMVSRTPVVGLNRNGLPELAGGHGFLVEFANKSVLADAILDALSDPARLERMAAAAQLHAHTYSWDRVAERMAEVVTRC